ncbi:MAG: galactofuranosyltransferase [Bacteroidales bacterium]|nr:galactofuranosyltransferase [Candidatus Liminaster caballi]
MNLYLRLPFNNKAKNDIDDLMEARGFRNVAVGSAWKGTVPRFFAKLLSVVMLVFRIHRGDVLLIQYPFKKYYPSLCRIARMRGAKTVTLIHDLGCFRRKKLTVEGEVRKLSRTDVLIVHNESMERFLRDHGYKRPMLTLGIFDYTAPAEPLGVPHHETGKAWDVVYAGGLAERKNRFLYVLDEALPADCCWTLHIHGRGLDETKASAWTHIKSRGFINSDDFVRQSIGHFGLVWDGSSIDECAGDWGVYLKVNNPHKTSFYLRSGKPVIIWREAALASFVEREGVGITVGSLRELDERLQKLTDEEYAQMVERVQTVRQRLATGYYFNDAFSRSLTLLND